MDIIKTQVDILVYVALSEEFAYVTEVLGTEFKPYELEDVALTCYLGSIESSIINRTFTVAVIPAGKMGNTRSATVTSALLDKVKPRDVVVLGIAGSLTNDLQPGDVFVPERVTEYLANSATVGDEDKWTFHTSGNHFQTSVRLLNRFQFFWSTQKACFDQWKTDTAQYSRLLALNEIREALVKAGLEMREESKLQVGDDKALASGPAVGKGTAFLEWIKKEVDRKVAAMEMESAGVYDAALIRTPAPRAIAIRGISDFADERKEKIEAAAKDRFRTVAVKNAVSLLVRGIQAGLFEQDAPHPLQGVVSALTSPPESRVRSVFVIGGITDETADPDSERPRLNRACLRLGRVLGRASAQLIVCSPFPDSADYYTVMGYSEGEERGVIHFHSPSHPTVAEKRRALSTLVGREGLTILDWLHPGPDDDEAWSQAWLLAELQALETADAVIAIGGKVSKTANTLLHLAAGRRVPIIPFTFLGGAAKRAFDRYDWQGLHPDLDCAILELENGIEKAIEIVNRLVTDAVRHEFRSGPKPRNFFISHARKDAAMAEVLINVLKHRGLQVLLGEEAIRSNQMVQSSIEQSILKSDVCIILWSQDYALSPWCYDELIIAATQQQRSNLQVWFYNLDDSPVVPKEGRKQTAISVRGRDAIVRVTEELLAHYGKQS